MVIGRDKEIVELNRLYNSHQAQFVAIYGRRRVGKTFGSSDISSDTAIMKGVKS